MAHIVIEMNGHPSLVPLAGGHVYMENEWADQWVVKVSDACGSTFLARGAQEACSVFLGWLIDEIEHGATIIRPRNFGATFSAQNGIKVIFPDS